MTLDLPCLTPSQVQAIDAQASVLMKQGIRLLGDAQPAVADALVCFDRALALRRQLPIASSPVLRYGLAACWLNRADALLRLADVERIPVALLAFDEAIVLLRDLPAGDDARYPRRLAIAHQNRGLALHAQGAQSIAAAIAAFEDAIAILDHEQARQIADRRYLLATVWTNLANARISENTTGSETLAREAALRAMALVANSEQRDPDAAEVGLTARHLRCQAIARRLALPAVAGAPMSGAVHEATDSVDDGLALVRRWEQQGVTRFRGIACDLFRFGVRVYDRYQPQFVDEFIREQSDPRQSSAAYVESAELRAAVQEALELIGRASR
jgi:tetratricopeptide (TPR) repeat protein